MRRKQDMIINYERSYKRLRRRRRRGSRFGKIIITVILAIVIGFAVYYLIASRIDFDGIKRSSITEKYVQENQQLQNSLTEESAGLEQDRLADEKNTVENPNGQAGQITVTPSATPIEEEKETTPDTQKRTPVKAKGIYVTASIAGSKDMNRLIEIAETTEINSMVIDVKGDTGKISYAMDSPMAQEIGANSNMIPDMEALIGTLKDKDIYLIARIVAFKDPYLAEQRQELAIKNKDGSLYRDNNGECWVNPYKHEVWEYLIEVATKAAEIGFDEIQFDYIRFSTGKGISDVDFGEAALTKSKEDIIIEFTKYAYEQLKPLGVFVSADVYGTIISSSIDAGLVGQNYVEMSKYLDYICPMIYPSHFGEGNYGIQYPDTEPLLIVRKALNASKEKLQQIPEGEHRAIVRPWLQDFTASWIEHYIPYGGKEVRAQIEGVYEAGYDEWLLWNASTIYSVDGLLEE